MPNACDIMSKKFHTIDREATVSEAVLLMNEYDCSSVIVRPQSPTDTYGILTMRDVVYKVVAPGLCVNELKVFEVMTKPLMMAQPQWSVKHVSRFMANCKVSTVPVIDGTKLVGIVYLKDVLADLHLIDSLK